MKKIYNVLSYGGGVQSSAMLLMACMGEITPKPDLVVFSDPGKESKKTYEYIRWISEEVKKHDIEVVTVIGGDIQGDIEKSIHGTGRFISLPFFMLSKSGGKGMV